MEGEERGEGEGAAETERKWAAGDVLVGPVQIGGVSLALALITRPLIGTFAP